MVVLHDVICDGRSQMGFAGAVRAKQDEPTFGLCCEVGRSVIGFGGARRFRIEIGKYLGLKGVEVAQR